MQVIPVIDLVGGSVVRAVRGERDSYRPIRSELCHGSDPRSVATALLERAASNVLYVADLDAVTGGPPQVGVLCELMAALPGVEVWIDAGLRDLEGWGRLAASLGRASGRVAPIFATESLASVEDAWCCLRSVNNCILSLDHRHGRPIDASGCWSDVDLWPDRVIVMSLDRVGAGAGPDLDLFRSVRERAPQSTFFGAGGIRTTDDLGAAARAGAAGWLVASALHELRIDPARLSRARPDLVS